jgi:hypothetical protein
MVYVGRLEGLKIVGWLDGWMIGAYEDSRMMFGLVLEPLCVEKFSTYFGVLKFLEIDSGLL